ncbi:hypothetical protein [Pseudomonas donghuensis]|uniref:hypothetical protein n=1 Tax=Pseudomonas donghuensis TaxID=1163398 RepID=UPI002E1201DA|nr:hypothetical protein VP780_10590 [Pseudomonas donghuensis]
MSGTDSRTRSTYQQQPLLAENRCWQGPSFRVPFLKKGCPIWFLNQQKDTETARENQKQQSPHKAGFVGRFVNNHELLETRYLVRDRNRINTKEFEFNGYYSSGYSSLSLKLSSAYLQP